jgi:MFS family permease
MPANLETNDATSHVAKPVSPWAAFQSANFAVLWSAGVVANIGTWMYSAASGWLMTDLDSDPFIVSMVQVASTLPMFMLALPAGALTDIIDRRRFLIVAEIVTTLLAAIFAAIVALGLVTPINLLVFTFLIAAASAVMVPAWQSIVPLLVPKQHLVRAVTTNSVGLNVSRAVGPALGGLITAAFGVAIPFWINAVSNLGVIGALFWWRSPPPSTHHLPAERFVSSIRTGLRHARNNSHLRATLVRAMSFFLFASAYWALLPLVARNQVAGGPELYGILLGAIGASAVAGAFALPWLEKKLGPDRLVAAGTVATAVTLALFGLAHDTIIAVIASLIAGAAWIAVLASLNVSAQFALPDWVRGRGLSIYVTVFFGSLTLGSAVWGKVAALIGLPAAHLLAAVGALAMIPLTRRLKLQTAADFDLTPSMHWPAPMTSYEVEPGRGPVLVTVEYRIDSERRDEFRSALEELGQERRRDGAYAWGVFEDTAIEGRFVETFYVASWLEHLRQHERVTEADRLLQERVAGLTLDSGPKTTHLVAARR